MESTCPRGVVGSFAESSLEVLEPPTLLIEFLSMIRTSLHWAMRCMALWSMLLPAVLWASNPEVASISPPGVERGKTTEIVIRGARLNDAKQILFASPGMEALQVTPVDEGSVKATIQVAPDCTCDLHAFRLVTSTGISNLRFLGVGALPIVDEVEPNSDFAAPQAITSNVTLHGVVKAEDVDYFAIDLKKGQPLTVEVEGLRLAYMNNFFDPFVAILDSKRFELARSDDLPLVQQDGICSFVAPEDGRYIIEVRESSFGGNDQSVYRLHVGGFPRPLSVYPAGGAPGETLQVTMVDGLGQTWQQAIQIPPQASGVHKVWADKEGMIPPSPNYLHVSPGVNVLEAIDNDDPNKAVVTEGMPIAFNGLLEKEDDQDWFGFTAKKDQQLEIRCYARGAIRSPVDAFLMVRKIGGGQLAANDDAGANTPDSFLSFKVPEDGNYAVGLRDHLGSGSAQHVYRIEISPVSPSINTTVNELERYFSQVVTVPAGARMAVEANLVRKAIGGEGALTIPDLPPGLTLKPTVVPGDQTTVTLMLHAAADAAPVGKLVDLQGTLTVSPENTLVGHLEQRSQIIRGRNNVDVWGYNGDRLAVSIAEAAPFDIAIVAPQVPIVRRGSMDLLVKAVRKEGFDKPISVRLLTNPPGVGSSGAISIPGDKSEAVIPLTANEGAAIKTSMITVLATYDSGRGPITIASEMVPLEVADSLFDFQFNKTVAEQGKTASIIVGIKPKREFEGTAEIEVLGLPPGTTSTQPKVTFAAGMEKLEFPLTVPAETRQGNYKTVVCRVNVTSPKGVISQTNGNAEVQVDVPLPPKTVAAAPAPTPMPAPVAAPAPAPEKPLTRLEQLRKMKEEGSGKK